jgi:hypothetical protein
MPQIIAIITAIFFLFSGCSGQSKELALQRKALESMRGEMHLMRKERAERTQGWWNWKLDETGWASWITTKTITATTTVAAFAVSLGYLYYKVYGIDKDLTSTANTAGQSWRRITNHEADPYAHTTQPQEILEELKVGEGGGAPEAKAPGESNKPSD